MYKYMYVCTCTCTQPTVWDTAPWHSGRSLTGSRRSSCQAQPPRSAPVGPGPSLSHPPYLEGGEGGRGGREGGTGREGRHQLHVQYM